ncbi:hypothetical protein Z043_109736 [Scleropages formosus]|uniref:CCR4-NOT transcription complex subunit 1 domain-containing protein n=1 Tax=Scleropages formosus TaxID=113540 RepID=A0A0P7VDM9_SCLFO|nr:hypothetical protein Z043_109736 [Scleropages formosus]
MSQKIQNSVVPFEHSTPVSKVEELKNTVKEEFMLWVSQYLVMKLIPLLQAHPQLKQCVRQTIKHAVQELMHPVVNQSIKITMTTCKQIRKYFALDLNKSRMHVAAHHMMRNLTASMVMITCKEPLLVSIADNLKSSFTTALQLYLHSLAQNPTPQQSDMMEEAAARIAQDKCKLTCCLFQRTAVEKQDQRWPRDWPP